MGSEDEKRKRTISFNHESRLRENGRRRTALLNDMYFFGGTISQKPDFCGDKENVPGDSIA
jgi:hypothetical protein